MMNIQSSNILNTKDSFLLYQIIKFKEENPNFKVGQIVITGSDCYGFRSKDSDYDIRGVFYYNAKDQLKIFNEKKRNYTFTEENKMDQIIKASEIESCANIEYRKYDFVFTEVRYFLHKLQSMNCTTLEQLFSNNPIYNDQWFIKLQKIFECNLAKKGLYDSYKGMSEFNYKHYIQSGLKPTAKKWLYVLRALLAGINSLSNHRIEQNIEILVDLSPLNEEERQIVMNLVNLKKNGYEETLLGADKGLEEIRNTLKYWLDKTYDLSTLPERPTDLLTEYLDYWLVDLRESY